MWIKRERGGVEREKERGGEGKEVKETKFS